MTNATLIQVFSSELAKTEFVDDKKMIVRTVEPIRGVVARDLDAEPTTDPTALIGQAAPGAPVNVEADVELQMHKGDGGEGEYIVNTVNQDGSPRGSFAFLTRI